MHLMQHSNYLLITSYRNAVILTLLPNVWTAAATNILGLHCRVQVLENRIRLSYAQGCKLVL